MVHFQHVRSCLWWNPYLSVCHSTLSVVEPFHFYIRLFNFIKFGKYLEKKLAGNTSYQKVMDVGVSFRGNLVITSRWTVKRFKEAHKFWEATEMDLFIVVCRCYAAVAHVPGAKFIHLMEKCACPTSLLIYKMCKRKGKYWRASNRILVLRNTVYCSLLVNYWDKWLQEVLPNLFSCSPCRITFHSKEYSSNALSHSNAQKGNCW